jgi:sulfate adenylyltransferase subunit 1 (EFTu-like GTPase family)
VSAAADQFEVELSWTGQEPLIPGRRYRLVLGTGSLHAAFAQPKYRLDPDTARQLG